MKYYKQIYDAHGNMTQMPHLQELKWDYADSLKEVTLDANGNTAYYVYDASGNRVRKIVVKGNITENRFYASDYELYTKTNNGTLETERETLHIKDNKQTVAVIDSDLQSSLFTFRFQLTNHLDSASIELDENADIISYEEYHPFGTTSYRSGRSETEVSLKRYKYVFKELDNETGLYYYGMRYYAPWVARFVSVDPLQFDYPYYTPFQYAGNKPISYIDLDGAEPYPAQYYKEKQGIINKYGMSAKGTAKIDSLDASYTMAKFSNNLNLKANNHTFREKQPLEDYGKQWAAMNSSYINNWIATDPIIKGYSAGAFTSMAIIGAEAYIMQGLQAKAWQHVAGGTTDAIGQWSFQMLQGKSAYESFLNINFSSVAFSGFNPTNSFTAFIGNGIGGNTIQYRLGKGFKVGSKEEVLYGTASEVAFGWGLGKTDGGIVNQSRYFKYHGLLDKRAANAITLQPLNKGAFSNTAGYFDYAWKKAQLNESAQLNLNFSKALDNSRLFISTFGQIQKNSFNSLFEQNTTSEQ